MSFIGEIKVEVPDDAEVNVKVEENAEIEDTDGQMFDEDDVLHSEVKCEETQILVGDGAQDRSINEKYGIRECYVKLKKLPEIIRSQTHIKCDMCSKTCVTKSGLTRHKQRIHGVKKSVARNIGHTKLVKSRKKVTRKKSEGPFVCDECPNKRLSTFWQFKYHQRSHTGDWTGVKRYQCYLCKLFPQSHGISGVRSHMRMHTGERPFPCDICGKKFACNAHLNAHKITHTNQKLFACNECPKRFTCPRNLAFHQRNIHTGDWANITSFQCYACKRFIKTKSSLQQHMRVHTGEKSFACEQCNKLYRYKNDLNTHKRDAHRSNDEPKEFKFKCSYCTYGARKNCQLLAHIARAHTGERSFACNECNRAYKTKDGLRAHKKCMHPVIGAPKFACKFCKHEFALKSNCTKHEKTICKGPILFACDFCSMKFRNKIEFDKHIKFIEGLKIGYECYLCKHKTHRKENLRSHMAKHTGFKRYACSVCPQKFAHFSLYKTHRDTKHKST